MIALAATLLGAAVRELSGASWAWRMLAVYGLPLGFLGPARSSSTSYRRR